MRMHEKSRERVRPQWSDRLPFPSAPFQTTPFRKASTSIPCLETR